jgi:DNA-directed RNA polymerase subunit RPC12/RpoP
MWNAFPAAMSEFKYACPVCGQHMKCDSSQSGTVMECPTCFQKITAPQAPATDAPKFIITGTKVGERPIPTAPVASGTAIPPEKDFPATTFVLIVLLCAVIGAAFLFRGKIFKTFPTKKIAVAHVSSTPSNPAPGSLTATVSDGNIASGRASFASSQQDQNPAQNGNDGNIETRWCAANGSAQQWWEVDLGGATAITNTQVLWEFGSVYQYAIEVSSNHTNWTTVVDKTANFTPAKESSDNFSASGRYVRIVVTGLQPHSWASFYEFRVFGSVVGSGAGGSNVNGNSTNQQ